MTTTTNIENQTENKDKREINNNNGENIKTILKEKEDSLSKSELQKITVDKKLKDLNSNSSNNLLSTNGKIFKKKLASAGCLTCRQRHKKCTRERPVCETCLKTGYTCFWREPGTKFTDYKVKLIHSDNPIGTVLKPNLLIDSTNNILSTEYHLSDYNDCIEVETQLDDSIINTTTTTTNNNNNNEDSLISLAKKAVSITNAYMNSPEMQNLLKKDLNDINNLNDIIDAKMQEKEKNDVISIKKELEDMIDLKEDKEDKKDKEDNEDNEDKENDESEDEGTECINGSSENFKVKKDDDSDSEGGNNSNNGNSDLNDSSNDNDKNNENLNNTTDNETKHDNNEQNQEKNPKNQNNNNGNFQDRLFDILENIEPIDNMCNDLIINKGTLIKNFNKRTPHNYNESWYRKYLSEDDNDDNFNINQNNLNSNFTTSTLTTTTSSISHLSDTKEIVPLGFQFNSNLSFSSSEFLVDHISVINYLLDNSTKKENDSTDLLKVPKRKESKVEKVIHRRQSDRLYNKFVDKKRNGKISKEEAARLLFDTISSSKLNNVKAIRKKLFTDGRRKIPKVIQ